MVLDELQPLNSSSSNRVPLQHYSSSEDPRRSLWSWQSASSPPPPPPPSSRNKPPDSSIWRYINGLLGRGESTRQEAKRRCQAIANRHSSKLANIGNSLDGSVASCDSPAEDVKKAGEEPNRNHNNNTKRFYRRTTMDQVDQRSRQLMRAHTRVSRSSSLRSPTQNSHQPPLHRSKVGNSLRGIRSGFRSCKISGEAKGEHLYRRSSEILRDSRRRFGSVFAALLIVATLFGANLLLLSLATTGVDGAAIPAAISAASGDSNLKDLQPLLSELNEGGDSILEEDASSLVDNELSSLAVDAANQASWYEADSQQGDSPLLIYDPNEDSKQPFAVTESELADYSDGDGDGGGEYSDESGPLPVSSDPASGGLERNKRDLVWLERRRLDRNRASEPPPWQKVLPERRDGYSAPTTSTTSKQVDSDTSADTGETLGAPQSRRSQRESASDLYNALLSGLLEGAFSNPELLDGVYNEIELKLKSDDGSTSAGSLSLAGPGGGKNKSQKLEQLQQHLARLVKWPLTGAGSDGAPGEPEDSPVKELDEEPEATLRIVGDELMSSVDEEKLVPNLEESTNSQQQRLLQQDQLQQQQQQPQSATYLEMDDISGLPEGYSSHGSADTLGMEQLSEGQSGRKPQLGLYPMLLVSDSRQSAPVANINMGPVGGQGSQQAPGLLAVEPEFHVLEDIDREDVGQLQNQQLPNEISGNSQQPTGAQQLLNQWGPVDSSGLQYDVSKRTLWPGWIAPGTGSQIADPSRLFYHLASKANNINRPSQQQRRQQPTGELMDQLALQLIESGYLDRNKLVEIGTKLKQYLEAVFGLPSDSIVGLYPISLQELLMKIDRVKVAMSSNHWPATNSAPNYDPTAPLFVIAAWPKGNKQNPIPLLSGILRTLGLNRAQQRPQLQLYKDKDEMSLQQRNPISPVPNLASSQSLEQHLRLIPSEVDDSSSSRLAALAAYLESIYSNTESALNPGSSSTTDLFGWKVSTILVVVLLALPSVLVLCAILVWLWCRRQPGGPRTPWTLRRSLTGSFRCLWPRNVNNNKSVPEDPLASWESQDSGLTGSCQPTETKEKACGADSHNASAGHSRGMAAAHQLACRLNELLKGIKRGSARNRVEHDDEARICDNEDIECPDAESTERLLPGGAAEARAPPVAASGCKFRTSQSYIRSLIEALSRASNTEAGGSSTANESPPQDLEEIGGGNEERSTGAGAGVVAQMDISAAHLILDYMERHLEDKEALKKEWLELRASSHSKLNQVALERQARVALMAKNKHKNVSHSVVPFDRNRIKLGCPPVGAQNLSDTSELEESYDYINASYIYDDNLRKPTHIIAQGPLEKTSGQFWQMVWEQNVSTIVMLTRLSEAGIRMCHCYWPSSVSASMASTSDRNQVANSQQDGRRMSVTSVYTSGNGHNGAKSASISVSNGDLNNNVLKFQIDMPVESRASEDSDSAKQLWRSLEVHLVSEHVSSSDYIVRNMYLVDQSTGETRNVTQFHYLQWPRDGIPSNVKSFLEFRRKVRKSYRNLSSPILVHDSDGGARSGTYTLIDIILERIRNGAKEIDPRATLEHLADQRPGLFPSQSQFEFVLLALAEEIQIILQALPQ